MCFFPEKTMFGPVARSGAASLIAADRPNRKGDARDWRGRIFDRGKAAKAESSAWWEELESEL